MAIESPCTKVCVIDRHSGRCIGCGRTGAEIAGWTGFSAEHRRALMAVLPGRMFAAPAGD